MTARHHLLMMQRLAQHSTLSWPPFPSVFEGERITTPVDKPVQTETQTLVDDEYLALAEGIGLDSPIVMDELLKRCLKQLKIFVYNTDHVEKYLRSKFENDKQRLVWKPMRQKDTATWGSATGGNSSIYLRSIPGHALIKADRLLKAFDHPDKLCFEVSDYETVRPDPFLSVRIANSQTRFVIAFWDEPNFRMEE